MNGGTSNASADGTLGGDAIAGAHTTNGGDSNANASAGVEALVSATADTTGGGHLQRQLGRPPGRHLRRQGGHG